jgi:hypothetical protein
MAKKVSTHASLITALASGDLVYIIRPSDGAGGSKIITVEDYIASLPVSVLSSALFNVPAWSIKLRNSGSVGPPQDAQVADLAEGSPESGDYLVGFKLSGSIARFAIDNLGVGAPSTPNRAYFQYLAAMLEPLAQEPFYTGTADYMIGGDVKLVQAAWDMKIAGAGRMDVRNSFRPLPLSNVTLAGNVTDSSAVFVDPNLPVYSNAESTYYARLAAIAAMTPKAVAISGLSTGANTRVFFLPGPYGNIVTHFTQFNATWLAFSTKSNTAWAIWDELGDATGDYMRLGVNTFIPVSKNVANRLTVGFSGGVGTAAGIVLHVILPSTWGAIIDATNYIFRDDFMGASLDTTTGWTRAQSTAGNVEIDTNWAWLKLKGDGTWGHNGAFSQTSTTRAAGKVFLCDVYVPLEANAGNHNAIVGWHDGSGQSYSDFAHGIDFTTSAGVRRLFAFENGNSRGAVGANPGYTEGETYRVRITLGSSNDATYEIQGGQYETIGGASWTDITPGTTSSSTSPLAIGASRESAGSLSYYLGDMKIIG